MTTHRFGDVTEQLNAVYAAEDSSLDATLAQLQTRSLPKGDWSAKKRILSRRHRGHRE